MALEDFVEPEVGIAVALTAAVASPKVRGALRRGAVYGLAGLLKVGDAMSSVARGVRSGVQEATAGDGAAPAATEPTAVTEPTVGTETPAVTVTEAGETPHKRARKPAEATNGE